MGALNEQFTGGHANGRICVDYYDPKKRKVKRLLGHVATGTKKIVIETPKKDVVDLKTWAAK